MRLITWNVNSVRLRMAHLTRLIAAHQPDVICLQETKVVDDAFPRKPLEACGYVHQHVQGMKSWNGVAILSRLPLVETGVRHSCGKEDCRHVYACLADGVRIDCLYVPAGGETPDPATNPKFAHKLAFLDALAAWWPQVASRRTPVIMAGDFNVAPLENDVWSHRAMGSVVSHTPIEVAHLAALQASLDWIDAGRRFVPETEKLFTWWSYRSQDWSRSNRGLRLDHIWLTPALEPRLQACRTLTDVRGWEPKPSDHAPVLLELA